MELVKQLIELNLKAFEEKTCFFSFFRALSFAKLYKKYNLNQNSNIKTEPLTIKNLQNYYFGSLKNALLWTKKGDNESDFEFKKRIKLNYKQFRKKAYLFLTQKTTDDYREILDVLCELTERKEKEIKQIQDNFNVFMTRYNV